MRGLNSIVKTIGVTGLALTLLVGSDTLASADDATEEAVIDDAIDDVNDPIEPLNRVFFELNEGLQVLILRPIADMYTIFLPPPFRTGVSNLIDNVRTPVILANDLLQGEGERAWKTTQRFFINSTVGVGGLWDAAEAWGIEGHDEDFGQTLAVWGVDEGFYMVLPVFGPSNPRDAVGTLVVDSFLDPLNWYLVNTDQTTELWARRGTEGVDEYAGVMEELDQIKRTSVDYYAGIRSMVRQKRRAKILNGRDDELLNIPDLSDRPGRDMDTATSGWGTAIRIAGAPEPVTHQQAGAGWGASVGAAPPVQVAGLGEDATALDAGGPNPWAAERWAVTTR